MGFILIYEWQYEVIILLQIVFDILLYFWIREHIKKGGA